MHDLSDELSALPGDAATDAAGVLALRLERREVLSVRPELLVALYGAVALLIAGVGLLVKANLDRIGPTTLLAAILVASALCYLVPLRARLARRDRSLGEDYILLLAALLFSTAVGYAEVQFRWFGTGWSRHLLLLAGWHLACAYLLRSRTILALALLAFAGWLGVEARLGTLFEPQHQLLGIAPRSLLCALVFYIGSHLHRGQDVQSGSGFREVYLHFAINFGFWGALALGFDSTTRWIGAAILLCLAAAVGRVGLRERRESFLLYAVAYSTIGLVWLETLLLGSFLLASWIGLATVIGAAVVLLNLRARLKDATQ